MKILSQKTMMTIALILAMMTATSTVQAQGVNMKKYITLTVDSGKEIDLKFKAGATNTAIRVESGSKTYDITANNEWTDFQKCISDGTTMTIYGDVKGFDCASNRKKINAIDISNNTDLAELYCGNNNLSTLDVSKNTQLTDLSCHSNQLATINVSNNTNLTYLSCSVNPISVLDVSKNTKLTVLSCYENTLTSLDVSNNSALTLLLCLDNQLDDCALDDLFRSLPARQTNDNARVFIKNDASSNPGADGCRTPIANTKNWKVLDFNYNDPIEINNTVFTCTTSNLIATKQSVAVSLYPNPVEDVLHISSEGEIRSIRVYNTGGAEVASAPAGAKSINISKLPAGTYAIQVETTKGIGTQRVMKR